MSLKPTFDLAGGLEKLLGRRQLWRLGRRLYLHARRDRLNDPELNGEYVLQTKIATLALGRTTPLRVIDVGANTGYWSERFLRTCEALGVRDVRLWAFEPSPQTRDALRRRFDLLASRYCAKIFEEAVADKAGVAEFDGREGFDGTKHLLTEAEVKEDTKRIDVTVTTLTDFFSVEGIEEANFVKSDTEGFDLNVIKGALSLLAARRIGVFQFEYNHRWVSTRHFLRDVFELVKDLPYRVCKIVPDGIEGYGDWHPELETYVEANFLLVRDDLAASLDVRNGRFDEYNTFGVR